MLGGLDWVIAQHRVPAVVNMSLGSYLSPALNEAVATAVAAGLTVVVAAGNDNADACQYSPAAAPAALTVGATGPTDARAAFSNDGACVDLLAPGVNIPSAGAGGDSATATLSGTSMATPHVAGAAALVLGRQPGATPAAVAEALTGRATADVLSGLGGEDRRRSLDADTAERPPVTAVWFWPALFSE